MGPDGQVTEEEQERVQRVEKILAYEFKDKSLAVEALTHPSYYFPSKPSATYERLEFIGDAVLSCLVAREMYVSYPDLAPGLLTRLRAANVDTEKLARVAVERGLHHFIRHKAPQFDIQIEEFREAIIQYPIHSNGLLDPPKVLADVVEALLGAIFVDTNDSIEIVWKIYTRLAEPLINLETLGRHPVSELLELCQKNKLELKFLKDNWIHNTTVGVMVDGKLFSSVTYGNKKETALNRAAKVALDRLKLMLVDHDSVEQTKYDALS